MSKGKFGRSPRASRQTEPSFLEITAGLAWTIPFVLIGIARYLQLVYRHDKGEQPERVLLTDLPLLLTLALYGLTVILVLRP